MSKARALLVLAFILVCAAGVVVGTAVDRTARPLATEKPRESFSQKLNLTPDQERQMHDIWDAFGKKRGQLYQQRHQLDQERENAIHALLTTEQQSEYDQIQKTYDQHRKDAEVEVQKAFREAEKDSRTVLTPEQQKTLDDMRKKMPHGPGPGGPGGMGSGMGPGMGPGKGGPPGFPHHDRRRSGNRSSTAPTTVPAL